MEFVAMVSDINKIVSDVHAGLLTKHQAAHDLMRVSGRAHWARAELDMAEQLEIQDLVENILREWGLA